MDELDFDENTTSDSSQSYQFSEDSNTDSTEHVIKGWDS